MQVHIKGYGVKRKALVVEYVHWVLNRLLAPHELRRVGVTITFGRGLRKHDYEAVAVIPSHPSAKRFNIKILNTLSFEETMITLAHELVHIKQYIRRELWVDLIDGFYVWRNTKFSFELIESLVYYDLPWEVEAYGRQLGLWYTFLERTNREHLVEA